MEKPKTFFLIDDDVDDIFLFREVLESIDPELKFLSAENGEIGLEMLKTSGDLPDIIFLDLNMPKMDGNNCLVEIKKDDSIKHIPVLIYSTSSHPKDIETTINNGAYCFITKPSTFSDLKLLLAEIISSLDDLPNGLKKISTRYSYLVCLG